MQEGVSYIISTKNRADFLARTLDNVREFIAPGDELIVMDGGSTDGTADVVAKNRDIVTSFVSEPDAGEAHGFNKGILLAGRRVIKPITDDDYFYPDAMKYAAQVMCEHPELDALVCGGEAYILDSATNEMSLFRYRRLPVGEKVQDVVNMLRFISCGLGLFLTRNGIARTGLFDLTFRLIDTEYLARLAATRCNVQYLDVKLYRHITYSHSASKLYPVQVRDTARVFLRFGEWETLMLKTTPQGLANALGADKLPGGRFLARCVFALETIRHKLPWLYVGLEWLFAPLAGLFGRVWKRLSKAETPRLLTEPEWDRSLRS